jgi:hypothetical protein
MTIKAIDWSKALIQSFVEDISRIEYIEISTSFVGLALNACIIIVLNALD